MKLPTTAARTVCPWPVFGHLPHFVRDSLSLLATWARHGNGEPLRLDRPTWLLTDPRDIRYVFRQTETKYGKLASLVGPAAQSLLGKSLLTLSGAPHRERRRLIQPVYSAETLTDNAAAIHKSTGEMLARWAPDSEVDIFREMRALSRTIILRILFGADYPNVTGSLGRALECRQAYIERGVRWRLPFRAWWPLPADFAGRRASRLLQETISTEIARRRATPIAERSLLDRMLLIRDHAGNRLEAGIVCDEAMAVLMAGHETIGETLGWSVWLMAENGPWCEGVSAEHLLAESLRLFPPTWLVVRESLEADTLPSGIRLPANAKLYLSQWVAHRCPAHFDNPDEFDAGRFVHRAASPGGSYFPFGEGSRVCAGRALAIHLGSQVLDLIRQSGALQPASATPPVPRAGMHLRPRSAVRLLWRPNPK